MKTDKKVPVVMIVATVFIASTAPTFGVQDCSDGSGAFTTATCCDRASTAARPAALLGNSAALTLAVKSEMQCQKHAAVEVGRIFPQGTQNPVTSAAPVAQVPALEEHVSLRDAQSLGSLTNDFASLQFQAADAQCKETKPFPLQFSGQTDVASGATDRLTVRRDFTPRHDALISGSKATGLSFAFSRSARGKLSVNAKAEGATGDWRGRAATDFGQFARGGFWGGDDSRKESEGLRLFSWRW